MAHTEQLAQLLKNLVEYFNLEDLRALCFDLGLDYYELRGEAKSARARDLITVMLRQNRLAALAERAGGHSFVVALRAPLCYPNRNIVRHASAIALTGLPA